MTRVEHIGGKLISFGNDKQIVTIYAIAPDDIDPPVYVGSTNQLLKIRIRAHVRAAMLNSPLPIHEWMRGRANFYVEVLEHVSPDQRLEREKFWVSKFSNLLNLTDGGSGLSGHKFAGTDHARRIGAKLRHGGEFACQTCGTYFWRKQREVNLGHNKYCCRSCFHISQRKALA